MCPLLFMRGVSGLSDERTTTRGEMRDFSGGGKLEMKTKEKREMMHDGDDS